MSNTGKVGKRLGVSDSYVRRLARQKKIKASKPGGRDWVVTSTKGYKKKRKK